MIQKGNRFLNQQSNGLVLLIFIFFHVGLMLELALIGHYESIGQLIPLISLTLSSASVFLYSKPSYLLLVKFFYLLTIISGILGVYLHLKSNWEFELEMYPNMDLFDLLKQSLTGAIPALAPGTLIPIGLLGFHLIQLKSNQTDK